MYRSANWKLLSKEQQLAIKREEKDRLFPFHRQEKRIRKAAVEIAENESQSKADRCFALHLLARDIMHLWQEEVATLNSFELLELGEKR